MLAPEGLEAA